MRLLIDAGNTRIKWAIIRGDVWLRNGILPVKEAAELAAHLENFNDINETWVSNVAGENVQRSIVRMGAGETRFIAAQKHQCGVHNGYANAAQLGSDRWAALIAAWHVTQGKCLVVNCGTATTIDSLSDKGEFLGGLILPGIELMQSSLVSAASNLHAAHGRYEEFPTNTSDAVISGAIQAGCGAIDRQHALLGLGAAVVLSGGAAWMLLPHLEKTVRNMDNLVLRGLELIAQEASAK